MSRSGFIIDPRNPGDLLHLPHRVDASARWFLGVKKGEEALIRCFGKAVAKTGLMDFFPVEEGGNGEDQPKT